MLSSDKHDFLLEFKKDLWCNQRRICFLLTCTHVSNCVFLLFPRRFLLRKAHGKIQSVWERCPFSVCLKWKSDCEKEMGKKIRFSVSSTFLDRLISGRCRIRSDLCLRICTPKKLDLSAQSFHLFLRISNTKILIGDQLVNNNYILSVTCDWL